MIGGSIDGLVHCKKIQQRGCCGFSLDSPQSNCGISTPAGTEGRLKVIQLYNILYLPYLWLSHFLITCVVVTTSVNAIYSLSGLY